MIEERNGFTWENYTRLVKYCGENIDDLMDSEDAAVICRMCDVLDIVDHEFEELEVNDVSIQEKIKARIELECLELIPDWELARLKKKK